MTALRRGAVAVAVAVLTLTGCGTDSPAGEGEPGATANEEEITMDGRPPMEEVLDRYEAMQRELVEALTADPGGLVWEPDSEGFGMTRAKCPEASPEAETATFRGLLARGGYEGADRERSLEVVEQVAARYGFEDVTTVVDRPDGVRIVAEDQYGGRLYYGTAVNTTMLVMTGCHEWESTPGEDYERDPVIEPAG